MKEQPHQSEGIPPSVLAALERLIRIAKADTGQSRHVLAD